MQITTTIGIDLGDRKSHACVLDDAGQVVSREVITTTKEGFTTFVRQFPGAQVVIEVSTHSRWVSALLQELGHHVLVANPAHVRLIYASTTKSDRFDAQALAKLARFDPSLLHPVRHRSKEAQDALAVVKSRDVLLRSRTALINHMRGVVKASGDRLPKCDADQFAKNIRACIPGTLADALSPILDVIERLTTEIRKFESWITRASKEKFPETERLLQVRGVGPVTALAFVLSIEDEKRFSTARDIGPYLGLVPKRRQSGNINPNLGISKTGDGYLRRLLVNCAHYISGPLGTDCDLRRFGHRLAPPGAKTRKKRAIVAVARKLAVLLMHLWKSGEQYEPLRNAEAA